MSARDSSLFELNETAAILWDAADGATPLEEIVERDICAAYEVDAATALRDARELALQLAEPRHLARVRRTLRTRGGTP